MEIKDLILLLMIPLLLICIVTYTNKFSITGYATAQQEKSNVIGTYSIMPSFKASIDYNLHDEYNAIDKKLKDIMSLCKERQDIKDCFKGETDKLGWACEEDNAAMILYDFIDKLNECLNLEDEKAVCKFSFDKRPSLNAKSGIFEISLANSIQKTKVELFENKKLIESDSIDLNGLYYTDFESRDKEGGKAETIKITLEYNKGIPEIKKIVASGDDGKETSLIKNLVLYKSKDTIKFIIDGFQKSFEVQPANKVISLPKTDGLRLCKKTGKTIMAYDGSDGLVNQRNIVYKFAVTFPKPVPGPLNKIDVIQAVNAEKSSVVMWDRPDADDIIYFSVYYSKKDFGDEKTTEMKSDSEIKKVSLDVYSSIVISDIDLNTCNFDSIGPCKYGAYNKPLEKDKLYYSTLKNKYFYLIKDVEDGMNYNYAVVAANEEGEIGNNKNAHGNSYILTKGKNYAQFTSSDKLPPERIDNFNRETIDSKEKLSWDLPTRNADGTELKDLAGFGIYYKKYFIGPFVPTSSKIDSSFLKKEIKISDAGCDAKPKCEYIMPELEKGQYYISIVAFDNNKNELKDFAQLK